MEIVKKETKEGLVEMNYKMNVEDFLDEYLLEECELEKGEEIFFFPAGTDDNDIGLDDMGVIDSIEGISDGTFRIRLSVQNKENSSVEFLVSKGSRIELAAVTSADCMMGFTIEDCLCEICEISEEGLTLKIVGIKR